jgi:reverse gyrase
MTQLATNLLRAWVNKQLSGKDCTLWKNFVNIMNQYSELFADRLIDIILKTNLFEYMDAETLKKYDFDFALVTGVGNVTKKSVNLSKGSLIPLGTTLCGLKRIEKKYKTSKFKIVVDDTKQKSSTSANVSMVLEKGNLIILNLVLRYKGDFSAQPAFTGTIDEQFKNLMKKECTGFR